MERSIALIDLEAGVGRTGAWPLFQLAPAVQLEGKFRCAFPEPAGLFHTLLPQAFTGRWTAHAVKQPDQ